MKERKIRVTEKAELKRRILALCEPNTIYQGHALEVLRRFPNECIDCCITSPPYWNLRNYHTAPVIWDGDDNCEHEWKEKLYRGQKTPHTKWRSAKKAFTQSASNFCSKCGAWRGELGAEPTPELYIAHLCQIFDEVKRVSKPTGTLWVNISDTYVDKGLVGIPEMFVLETQKRGWMRRNTIIWEKPNAMPESVKDRFTVDFEYVYFFVKDKTYNFRQQTEPCSESYLCDSRPPGILRQRLYENSKYRKHDYGNNQFKDPSIYNGKFKDVKDAEQYGSPRARTQRRRGNSVKLLGKSYNSKLERNKRCVWRIPTARFPGAHFAVFPEELAETPIKAGCPEGGIVLDPFAGVFTTCLVAEKLGRKWIGIELSPDYCKMSEARVRAVRGKSETSAAERLEILDLEAVAAEEEAALASQIFGKKAA